MSDVYRLYGVELSPYSVKVRSHLRYKGVPHLWIVRDAETTAEYQAKAKLPIIPLLVTPEGEAWQDSTPIMEAIEARFASPSIDPDDPVAAFVSILLEEFGDEWGNKWMFHLRWARDEDALSAGGRIAATMAKPGDEGARIAIREKVVERMRGRVWFVGSSAETAARIERSFRDAIGLLDRHLATRPYVFGGRPSWGDFGLWGQVYNAWTDPTGSAWIESSGRHVLDWIHRMLWPRAEGGFESWSTLAATLEPFLASQVGALFCPWTLANAVAIESGSETFTVDLAGEPFSQKPQKYHAKSLRALQTKYAALSAGDRKAVDPVLERTGCLEAMRGGGGA
ncbi:MAG TPA: glutathione S-transferase family protein [Myxococcota bacterium]|nr:glutathione S-transferase family protein [Myxococcota bacterium]